MFPVLSFLIRASTAPMMKKFFTYALYIQPRDLFKSLMQWYSNPIYLNLKHSTSHGSLMKFLTRSTTQIYRFSLNPVTGQSK